MSRGRRRALAVVNRALRPFELELARPRRTERASTEGVLGHLAGAGPAPETVIDAGAAYGDWSLACSRVFPTARYLLVEPLREFAPILEARARELGPATIVSAAAVASSGSHTLRVHPDLVGSSTLVEEGGAVEAEERIVEGVRLDDLAERYGTTAPYLLKLDVQGGELDALAGAAATLRETALLVLEVSFLPFFAEGPALADVVAALRAAGFAAYDVANLLYRPLDGALAQADVVFVPEKSQLRRPGFADAEQRAEQDRRFRRAHAERLGLLPTDKRPRQAGLGRPGK